MRTKSRSRREQVAASVCAVVLLAAISALALTRSTTPTAPSGAAVADAIIPPENEAAEMALGTDPNALLDLKQGSDQDVTVAQVRQMQAQAAQVEAAATGIAWKQLGPYNIGGRLTDVVADVDQPNTVYSAVAGGGIWRSTDGGANWTNIWPNSNTQPMGSLEQAEDGTLWAGTGEANPPGGGLTYFGDGIYKSTDRGATWTNTGLRDSEAIGRIATDPTNSNRVFAAASGHIARSSGDRGLYRTEDAGRTWERVLTPPNASTGAIDVAIHPTNPQIVFASLWDHRRTNGRRIYGGVGSGLFRSTDGGDTWTRLENIVPTPGYTPTPPALATYDADPVGSDLAREPGPDRHRARADQACGRGQQSRLRRLRQPDRPRQGLLPLHRQRQLLLLPAARADAHDPGARVRPRPPVRRRLPVVVRADVRRPGGPAAPLQLRREPARFDRRRQDLVGERRRPGRRRQRARRPARDGLGPVDAGRQPGDGAPGLPRQRRRHLPVGHRRQQRHVGPSRRAAVEPGLQPGHLDAGRTAPDHGPAGQRQREDVGVADQPPAGHRGSPRLALARRR